jgi:hypothetical protein
MSAGQGRLADMEPTTLPAADALLRPADARDALELGRLCEERLVRRVLGDVHVAVDHPDDLAVRAAAARAVLPRRLIAAGAAVSGPSAAWLHAGGPAPEALHVTLAAGHGRSAAPFVVVHEGRLVPGDVVDVDGVPVTVPERTAADVARLLPPAHALTVIGLLATLTPLDPRDVLVHLERLSGCRGVGTARRTVAAWRGARR